MRFHVFLFFLFMDDIYRNSNSLIVEDVHYQMIARQCKIKYRLTIRLNSSQTPQIPASAGREDSALFQLPARPSA